MTAPASNALLSPRLYAECNSCRAFNWRPPQPICRSVGRVVPFSLEGQAIVKPEDRPWARYYAISPDYLHVMHTQLISGRGLSATDSAGKPAVALVNQAFVKQIASNSKVLGKTVTVALTPSAGQTGAEIVGVVENVADY